MKGVPWTRPLAALPDRLRLVLELRFLSEPPCTLKQVGMRLGVSYQRAGQLQATALWRLGWRLRLRPAGKPAPKPFTGRE